MDFKKIKYSVENHAARIALNSPENLNAFDEIMIDEISEALKLVEKDDGIKAVVLAGEGKGFSAGGDIRAMYAALKSQDFEFGAAVKKVGQLALNIKKLSKPVIAELHGAVAGAGANIALACDFCIASEDTRFIEAFVNLGLVPDAGGAYLLTRAIGVNRAVELMMTGRPVNAGEALQLGIVNKVVPGEKLFEEVQNYVCRLAAAPSQAIAGMKALVFESEYKGFEKFLELEESLQKKCGSTEDFREGVFAFAEKRLPRFTGK